MLHIKLLTFSTNKLFYNEVYLLTISLTLTWPMANTIAFGGVATGRMNAMEHANTAGYSR